MEQRKPAEWNVERGTKQDSRTGDGEEKASHAMTQKVSQEKSIPYKQRGGRAEDAVVEWVGKKATFLGV